METISNCLKDYKFFSSIYALLLYCIFLWNVFKQLKRSKYINYEFCSIIILLWFTVRWKEMLLRFSKVPLEIFTLVFSEMMLRFLGILFAFSLLLVKMSLRFILLFILEVFIQIKYFNKNLTQHCIQQKYVKSIA